MITPDSKVSGVTGGILGTRQPSEDWPPGLPSFATLSQGLGYRLRV